MWGEGDWAVKRVSKGEAVEEIYQIMKIWEVLSQPLWLLDLEREWSTRREDMSEFPAH